MMPRLAKTYGRNPQREAAYATKAFDDLLKDNRPSTAKAATTGSKWGKTSFTSTRASGTPTPMDEVVETKKRKVESKVESNPIDLFDDPFSFDEDEGPIKSRKTERGRGSPLTLGAAQPKALTKPVAVSGRPNAASSVSLSSSKGLRVSGVRTYNEQDEEDVEDETPVVRKVAIKTYSRSNKNGATKSVIRPLGKDNSSGSGSSSSGVSSGATNNNRITLSVDNHTQKMPILTISRDRLNRHTINNSTTGGGSQGDSKPVKKKFFVTSPTKSVDEDHNYSHKEDSSVSGSQDNTKLFESDYELDSEEDLESGDPEITFNSPKKRREAEQLTAVTVSDNDTLPDDDPHPMSPFSMTDEEDDDKEPTSSTSSTSRAPPQQRYTATYSSTKRTLTLTKAYSTGTTVRPSPAPAAASSSQGAAPTGRTERKPIFTYSRNRGANNSTAAAATNSQSDSRAGSSDMDTGRHFRSSAADSRHVRADSPASVGSASSSASTSSATGNQRSLKLTYSRKSRSDADAKGGLLVRKLLTSPKKKVAVYNPRPWSSDADGVHNDDDQPAAGNKPTSRPAAPTSSSIFDDDFDADDDDLETPLTRQPVLTQPKFRRRVTAPERGGWPGDEPVSTLRVTKEHKPLFTVVRNVKQAHECQEHGETQEFQDDIDYILDGLQGTQKETLRCLSTISLVSKSAMPAFRMHLRAHGTITKIFSALRDAPDYPTLALCTSGVMFMLSRDRLNMDLDKTSLQLMLNLLSVDSRIPTELAALSEYNRMKKRIQTICENLNVDGKARQFHLDLCDISPGKLAMETLLSLTSRKAGDWFKEELRELGGLDHIVSTVSKCSDSLDEVEIEPTAAMLNTLKKIDRCLRVLENVTLMNTENQNFLLHHNDSELTVSVCGALRVCENCQPFNPVELDGDGKVDKETTGYVVFSCLLAVLRVLLNLTHDNEYGCRALGQQSGIITTLLRCVLQVPQYIHIEQRFDLLVLSLGLMINMMEHSDANRQMLVEETTQGHYDSQNAGRQVGAATALTQFFVARFDAAERLEAEQAADHEQLKKAGRGAKTGDAGGDAREDADASGLWRESESGLEWVVIPEDERGKNGHIGANPIGVGEEEDALGHSSDEDDLDLLGGSQEEDENFTKALHKAGRHMEDSFIAAYVSLLIGVLLQNNSDLVDEIREEMPEGSFEPMIKMLKKFLGFMNFTSSVSNGGKSIISVIKTLEAC